ncbi:MAG TPA: hypothetical protein VLT61_05700, partial [Anaeromyxobacteraceae bacterium]|nr:hypothetical protein [Anaeromyxobacteraceae bacterium]
MHAIKHTSRATAARSALALTALSALLSGHAAAAKAPPAKPPISLAAPKSFAAAVAAIEKATGSKGADLELKGNPLPAE